MKNSDQKLARQLLKLRDNGYNPWKLGLLSRKQFLRILVLLVYGLLWQSYSYSQLVTTVIALGGGVIVGAMINEIIFIFRISKTWAFTTKVTDWEIVEKLAKKKSSPSEHLP